MNAVLANKVRRKWRDLSTTRVDCGPGPAGAAKIGVVLYLDYEREFAHEDAKATAGRGFSEILRILCRHGVRATWNCVGLIGEHYPETIWQLKDEAQEIASHTHRHIVPLKTQKDRLKRDIGDHQALFRDRFDVELQGFHSPQDAWSGPLIAVLRELGFLYDIAVETKDERRRLSRLSPAWRAQGERDRGFIRIPSVGDDWSFISEDLPAVQMLERWRGVICDEYRGRTIAMGVHPWIIGQQDQRIEIFDEFIGLLKQSDLVEIYTGAEVAAWCESSGR